MSRKSPENSNHPLSTREASFREKELSKSRSRSRSRSRSPRRVRNPATLVENSEKNIHHLIEEIRNLPRVDDVAEQFYRTFCALDFTALTHADLITILEKLCFFASKDPELYASMMDPLLVCIQRQFNVYNENNVKLINFLNTLIKNKVIYFNANFIKSMLLLIGKAQGYLSQCSKSEFFGYLQSFVATLLLETPNSSLSKEGNVEEFMIALLTGLGEKSEERVKNQIIKLANFLKNSRNNDLKEKSCFILMVLQHDKLSAGEVIKLLDKTAEYFNRIGLEIVCSILLNTVRNMQGQPIAIQQTAQNALDNVIQLLHKHGRTVFVLSFYQQLKATTVQNNHFFMVLELAFRYVQYLPRQLDASTQIELAFADKEINTDPAPRTIDEIVGTDIRVEHKEVATDSLLTASKEIATEPVPAAASAANASFDSVIHDDESMLADDERSPEEQPEIQHKTGQAGGDESKVVNLAQDEIDSQALIQLINSSKKRGANDHIWTNSQWVRFIAGQFTIHNLAVFQSILKKKNYSLFSRVIKNHDLRKKLIDEVTLATPKEKKIIAGLLMDFYSTKRTSAPKEDNLRGNVQLLLIAIGETILLDLNVKLDADFRQLGLGVHKTAISDQRSCLREAINQLRKLQYLPPLPKIARSKAAAERISSDKFNAGDVAMGTENPVGDEQKEITPPSSGGASAGGSSSDRDRPVDMQHDLTVMPVAADTNSLDGLVEELTVAAGRIDFEILQKNPQWQKFINNQCTTDNLRIFQCLLKLNNPQPFYKVVDQEAIQKTILEEIKDASNDNKKSLVHLLLEYYYFLATSNYRSSSQRTTIIHDIRLFLTGINQEILISCRDELAVNAANSKRKKRDMLDCVAGAIDQLRRINNLPPIPRMTNVRLNTTPGLMARLSEADLSSSQYELSVEGLVKFLNELPTMRNTYYTNVNPLWIHFKAGKFEKKNLDVLRCILQLRKSAVFLQLVDSQAACAKLIDEIKALTADEKKTLLDLLMDFVGNVRTYKGVSSERNLAQDVCKFVGAIDENILMTYLETLEKEYQKNKRDNVIVNARYCLLRAINHLRAARGEVVLPGLVSKVPLTFALGGGSEIRASDALIQIIQSLPVGKGTRFDFDVFQKMVCWQQFIAGKFKQGNLPTLICILKSRKGNLFFAAANNSRAAQKIIAEIKEASEQTKTELTELLLELYAALNGYNRIEGSLLKDVRFFLVEIDVDIRLSCKEKLTTELSAAADPQRFNYIKRKLECLNQLVAKKANNPIVVRPHLETSALGAAVLKTVSIEGGERILPPLPIPPPLPMPAMPPSPAFNIGQPLAEATNLELPQLSAFLDSAGASTAALLSQVGIFSPRTSALGIGTPSFDLLVDDFELFAKAGEEHKPDMCT